MNENERLQAEEWLRAQEEWAEEDAETQAQIDADAFWEDLRDEGYDVDDF